MASPPANSVGRLRPTGRRARMKCRRPDGSLLTRCRSPGQEARSAQEKPRCARRILEREAPQDRDRRLARVRDRRVHPRRRDRHQHARRRGHRQRRIARRRHRDPQRELPGQGRRAGARPGPRRQAERSSDPAVKAGIEDVVARLEKAKHVQDVKSPLAKGNEGQISEDGRSALVTFSLPDPEEGSDETRRRLARGHRGGAEGEPRPADRAVRRLLRRQGARRRARRRLQARGVPQPPDHDDHPDRRLRRAGGRRHPAAAGDHGRDRHARPGRPDQPDRPDGGAPRTP